MVVLEAVLTKVFLTKAEALLASVLLEEVLLLEEMLLAALINCGIPVLQAGVGRAAVVLPNEISSFANCIFV